MLAAAGRQSEAALCFAEGVEILWPFFEHHPAAFVDLMDFLLNGCITHMDGPASPVLLQRQMHFQILIG